MFCSVQNLEMGEIALVKMADIFNQLHDDGEWRHNHIQI